MYVLLLLLALTSSSFGADIITLSNANDFTKFVDEVNSGNNYSGTTVYLGSDITLTESIGPIGNKTNQFRGVFDGQGYIINDLTINFTSETAGLFGYSYGLTIRNIVLDSSCSITNSYVSDSDDAYIGGVIGECATNNDHCNIEDIVNMADVTFNGNISNKLYLGGVVGYLFSQSNSVYVKNCVNYGSVTHSGTVRDNWVNLGGIAGVSGGISSYNYIQNCLNYGTITQNGTSTNLAIGGIVSCGSSYTYIENCVSAGKIVITTAPSGDKYVGSIVGLVYSNIHINYCYYTSDVNASNINGYGTPSSTTGTPNSSANIDFDLVSKLNSNATSCNWNKWLLNANNATVTFKMNDGKELSFSSQVILVPSPVKEGNSFLFWCKDADCTEEFEAESVSGITNLYAAWVNNTVTFDVSGGNPLSEDEATKIVTFNETYGVLPIPSMTGHSFVGWFNESNKLVTDETTVTTPKSHTLHARWEEITNQVEIVFNTKDLSKEDVEKFIEQYAKAGFEIIKYEEESGEIRTVIKFADKEDAEMFVRNINESDEAKGLIKRIGFDQGDDNSFSPMTYPLSFLSLLFL